VREGDSIWHMIAEAPTKLDHRIIFNGRLNSYGDDVPRLSFVGAVEGESNKKSRENHLLIRRMGEETVLDVIYSRTTKKKDTYWGQRRNHKKINRKWKKRRSGDSIQLK